MTGPVHGCSYLFVILATARHAQGTGRLTALALIPGVGGLLVLRRLARVRPSTAERPLRSVPQGPER
ncbi:hypothetical protein AB0I22_20930 [Streptomyces sp. NPDC050610]|uniref:hypothetical protein n=1 Tax=Streptomyces sp. NPDC050610 TaxID=3157097 RepID=UPI0034459CE1